MIDNSAPIPYLPSFMRSLPENFLDISSRDSLEPTSVDTSISTLVDVPSISHLSPNHDDAYVNLVSHEDASGSSSSSCGLSSSSPPIFHSDEDIMEAMTTPTYPWDDIHHHVYFLPQ